MIKLENISKYYYSANAVVPALRKIKLEFHVGEFVAITGESGSGKSTLLGIISGLDTYDDGELYIDGEVTSDYDTTDWENYRKNKIGFVFQNYNLIEHYSVLSNVESALLILGHEVKEAKKVAKDLIAKVGLSRQLYQKASRLSTGQKQRLSIARALAKNTDIIIADEPTGNLDSENGNQIWQLLSELSKEKLIITVTHNYEEAAPYVTRKIRLHDGEVVGDTLVKQEVDVNLKDTYHIEAPSDAGAGKGNEQGSNVEKEAATENDKYKVSKGDQHKEGRKIAWRFTRMNIITQLGRVIFFTSFLLLIAGVSFVFLGEIYKNWDDTDTKQYKKEIFYNPDSTRIVVKKPDGSDINQQDMDTFNQIKYVEMSDKHDYANDINYYWLEDRDYEIIYRSNDDLQSTQRIMEVELLNDTEFVKSSTCITQDDLSAGILPQKRNEVVIYAEDPSVLGMEQTCYFKSANSWGFNDYYSITVKIVGIQKKYNNQIFFSEELCEMLTVTMYDENYSLAFSKDVITNTYLNNIKAYPVIGEDLNYGEIRVSADLVATNDHSLDGAAKLTVYLPSGEMVTYDAVELLPDFHFNTKHFIEVNEEWFYELYQHNSKQASLYMDDYIHTDYVLKKLNKLGYDAISSFRTGSDEYDIYKQADHNFLIIRSFVVLLAIFILEILIVVAALKIRNKDMSILVSMGMEQKTIKLMNYYEMYVYFAVAIALVIVAANIVRLLEVTRFLDMIKYYNVYTYLIFVTLNFTVISFAVWLFHKYLKRKQKWS